MIQTEVNEPPRFLIVRKPIDRRRRRKALLELKVNSPYINEVIKQFENDVLTKEEATKKLEEVTNRLATAGRFIFAVPNLEYFNQL